MLKNRTNRVVACLLAWLQLVMIASCLADADPSLSLSELSIEELLNVSVTSVAKKETKLYESPAAVTLITQEDIRQSNLRTIPDLLRMVPGMEVSQNSAHEWSVGTRGFADVFANKVQVLIDGRTLYSTAIGGVHWDVQDILLEDVDRIEVIRGPGATLWGANAVNGVVNIVSKSAKDTQGMLLSTIYGTDDQPTSSLRYGGQLGTNLFYRVYLKYFDRRGSVDDQGASVPDSWRAIRGGFRFDYEPSAQNTLTFQGDTYDGQFHEVGTAPRLTAPFSVTEREVSRDHGVNALSRWTHAFSGDSQLTFQLYYDRAVEKIDTEKESHDIYDLDLQEHFALGSRNDVVAGIGYRQTKDEITPTPELTVDPVKRNLNFWNLFVQDTLNVVEDKLALTFGSKFEHNSFTGFEFQPSARLLWKADQRNTFWTALSRAVRTPTRLERDGRLLTEVQAPASAFVDFGNPNLKSEELLAYEFGYRVAPMKNLSFDLSMFFNSYSHLVWFTPTGSSFVELTPSPVHTVFPSVAENNVHGYNYGLELSSKYQPWSHWTLSSGYSWLRSHFPRGYEEGNPEHQFFIRTHVVVSPQVELDSAASYFTAISSSQISGYLRWDLGLTWHPTHWMDVSLVGENLASRRHREFDAMDSTSRIPRTVFGKVTVRF